MFSEPSEEPLEDFKQAIAEIKKLALDANQIDGGSLINRMCFSQSFAAFEAYLADVIINAVNNDIAKRQSLISRDKVLNSLKVTLADVGSDPDIVAKKVNAHLREVVYHNIPRINPMFEAVFGARVIADNSEMEKAMKLVEDRHDCVHRNGRSKGNELPNKFSVIFVLETIEFLEGIVIRLEESIGVGMEFELF